MGTFTDLLVGFFESLSLLVEFSTRSLLFNAMGIAYIIM